MLVSTVEGDVYAEVLSSIKAISPSGTAAIIYENGNVVASTRTYRTNGFYNLFDSPYITEDIKGQYEAALLGSNTSFFQV